MFITSLNPAPEDSERFEYPDLRRLPAEPGCYVLTTVGGVIIYIGQSINILNRVAQHFDDPNKQMPTPDGVAFWCHYLRTSKYNLDRLERGWLNAHVLCEGALPHFNKVGGPS